MRGQLPHVRRSSLWPPPPLLGANIADALSSAASALIQDTGHVVCDANTSVRAVNNTSSRIHRRRSLRAFGHQENHVGPARDVASECISSFKRSCDSLHMMTMPHLQITYELAHAIYHRYGDSTVICAPWTPYHAPQARRPAWARCAPSLPARRTPRRRIPR